MKKVKEIPPISDIQCYYRSRPLPKSIQRKIERKERKKARKRLGYALWMEKTKGMHRNNLGVKDPDKAQ